MRIRVDIFSQALCSSTDSFVFSFFFFAGTFIWLCSPEPELSFSCEAHLKEVQEWVNTQGCMYWISKKSTSTPTDKTFRWLFAGGGNDSDSGRPETALREGSLTVAEIVCIGFVMKEPGGFSVGCQWGSLFSFDSASNPCKQPRGCLLAPSHPGWMVWSEKRLRVMQAWSCW